jgi:large subunit ribosomal protein L11
MAKKEVQAVIKLVIPAGGASMAPPVGPTLSPYGINGADFCSQFNAKTKKDNGILTPAILTIYKDRTFSFELKTPPTSELIRRTLGIKKGSAVPNLKKVGKLSVAQLKEIATVKLPDLNTDDLDEAIKIIAGTARQMGVETDL